MKNLVFHGRVSNHKWIVTVKKDGEEFETNLPLYLDEVNHHQKSFGWGYNGGGPLQLAYAIMRFYYEHNREYTAWRSINCTEAIYLGFLHSIIRPLPMECEWVITSDDIYAWLNGERIKISYVITGEIISHL